MIVVACFVVMFCSKFYRDFDLLSKDICLFNYGNMVALYRLLNGAAPVLIKAQLVWKNTLFLLAKYLLTSAVFIAV